jgi:hypothetical protein
MTYAKLLKMAGAFQPRLFEHEIAELYSGGEAMLNDLRKMGLEPVKQRSTSLVYDRVDIDTFIDRAKQEGIWRQKSKKGEQN